MESSAGNLTIFPPYIHKAFKDFKHIRDISAPLYMSLD